MREGETQEGGGRRRMEDETQDGDERRLLHRETQEGDERSLLHQVTQDVDDRSLLHHVTQDVDGRVENREGELPELFQRPFLKAWTSPGLQFQPQLWSRKSTLSNYTALAWVDVKMITAPSHSPGLFKEDGSRPMRTYPDHKTDLITFQDID